MEIANASGTQSPIPLFNPSIKNLAWAMVESMEDSLIVTTSAGHILYLNNAAEQLLNVTFSHAYMKRLDGLLQLEALDEHTESSASNNSGNRTSSFKRGQWAGRWTLMQDGHKMAVDIRTSLVRHDPNASANLLLSIRTIAPEIAKQPMKIVPTSEPQLLDNNGFVRKIRDAYNDSLHNDSEHCLLCVTVDNERETCCGVDAIVSDTFGPNHSLYRLNHHKIGVLLNGHSLTQALRAATTLLQQASKTECPTMWIGVAPINRFSSGIPANLLAMALVACSQAKLSGEVRAVRAFQPGGRETFIDPETLQPGIARHGDVDSACG